MMENDSEIPASPQTSKPMRRRRTDQFNSVLMMDSDSEIPASPPSKPQSRRRKKHKNLSLGSGKRKSMTHQSEPARASTSDVAGAAKPKIDIYSCLEEDDDSMDCCRLTIPDDFDIYASARLLEKGDVPMSRAEIRAIRASKKNKTSTRELISVRELMELQQNAAPEGDAELKCSSGSQGSIKSPLASVRGLLDEAKQLLENSSPISEWPLESPEPASLHEKLEKDAPKGSENTMPKIAQTILKDFQAESSDDSTPQTPPWLFLKKPSRQYTARKRVNRTVSAEANSEVDYSASQSLCDEDIDLNASFMIQKNMADLSGLFESQLQPQQIDWELDDATFEQGPQSGDEPPTLSDQSSDSDQSETVRSGTCAHGGFLSEDDDIFSRIATPRITSATKATKRNRDSTISDFAEVAVSTPSTTSKLATKGTSLHPKRLRFELDHNAAVSAPSIEDFAGGFKSARGANVSGSAPKIGKTANIFDEIMADFEGLPFVGVPECSSFAGFQSASKVTVKSPTEENMSPNRFEAPRPIDAPVEPSTSTGFRTAHTAPIGLPSMEELANPTLGMASTSAGFFTARGQRVQQPNSAAVKKSLKLFDFEQDDAGFDLGITPKKHVKWKDDLDASGPSNASVFGGFKTAVGTSINVSADTFKKYAALFEEEINEDWHDRCDGDTSTVTVSPFHKPTQAKFITSTPNVAAKVLLDDSCDDFLKHLDDQVLTEMFSSPMHQKAVRPGKVNYIGFSPSMVPAHVKIGRKEALERQQANCLRKNSIRMQSGAMFKQKSAAKRTALKTLGTPKVYSRDQLIQLGVPAHVIEVDIECVESFKFDMWRYYSIDECTHNTNGIHLDDGIKLIMDENSRAGFDELSSGFLDCDSVDPKLVPDNWIRNCLKWILLKLAGLERNFPQTYAGNSVTPANVMMQLKYRYDREIDRSQRSALRKIVEQDDAASKPLVLFVSRIKHTNPLECSLELSDGWYAIGSGALDQVLTRAVRERKIRVGTKLLIQDAELIGVEEACSPLEMPSSTALKFSANSSRRVKWHTKLGYFNGGCSIPFPLRSITPHGGHICQLTAFIVRIYPMLFVTKTTQATSGDNDNQPTSTTVIRSEKLHRRLEAIEYKKRFDIFEALCAEATAEVEREYEVKRKESFSMPRRKLSEVDDAEELWHMMEMSNDAESFENELSITQKTMFQLYGERVNQEKNNEIRLRVKEKYDQKAKNSSATPLLKIRIVDCEQPTTSRSAVLSVWGADESYFDLRENSFIEITGASASGLRGKDLLLQANGRTKIRSVDQPSITNAHNTVRRKCHHLADINADSFTPHFNEFDVVACVLHIEPLANSRFQTINFVDSQQNILLVKFWNGMEQFGFDDVIRVGEILAIGNLDWRPANRKSKSGWPQAFASDMTTFSASPKSHVMVERLRQLDASFRGMADKDAYLEECMAIMRERCDSGNSSRSSTTLLSVTNLSPMNQTLNTSKSADTSRSRAKMKMEQLKVYKSPPPPPAINVSGTSMSALRKPFKIPSTTAMQLRDADNQENEM